MEIGSMEIIISKEDVFCCIVALTGTNKCLVQ